MESDNADGPSIKAAFPCTQCCFHVVCESSDPESPQIPKEVGISYHSGCGIVMLASVVVFLLIVPVLPFSPISLILLSLSFWSRLVPYLQVCSWHTCPLCGLCALTLSKTVSRFSLGISQFLCSSTYLWLTNHPKNYCVHLWMLGLRTWLYLHAHDFGEQFHCLRGCSTPALQLQKDNWLLLETRGFAIPLIYVYTWVLVCVSYVIFFLPFPSFRQEWHKENSSKVIKFLQIL